jgi:HEAT repeat protein
VALLDGMLNGKTLLGAREDSEIRAAAAAGLGRVGTPKARESLQRAGGDKDVVVRNAVARSLRGGTP